MWLYGNKQTGIILLTVLVFLQILSMLGIYALQSGFLQQTTSHQRWRKQLQLQNAEQRLKQIETKNIENCVIPYTNRSLISMQPLDWWRSRVGCTEQTVDYLYYYFFEALGESPCAYIDEPQINKSVYYFRVTLLLISEINSDDKQILQSTIIKMDNALRKCEGKLHRVIPGRQMWRAFI